MSPVMVKWSPLKKSLRKENVPISLEPGLSHIRRNQANSINFDLNQISSQTVLAEYQNILYSSLVSPILP